MDSLLRIVTSRDSPQIGHEAVHQLSFPSPLRVTSIAWSHSLEVFFISGLYIRGRTMFARAREGDFSKGLWIVQGELWFGDEIDASAASSLPHFKRQVFECVNIISRPSPWWIKAAVQLLKSRRRR